MKKLNNIESLSYCGAHARIIFNIAQEFPILSMYRKNPNFINVQKFE